MASQSPSIESLPDNLLPGGDANSQQYLDGWAALSTLIDRGYSWSGHERNCAFLNEGDGEFLEVSAISGLDFDDDGRSCTVTDLDGDGDLDLVLKNRSGPQLRILRNRLGSGKALLIKLVEEDGNMDAIGARVELVAGPRRLVRCVTAGDGYLGQASSWLHFGLEGLPALERLLVTWPDGSVEEFTPPEQKGRYLAVRGSGSLQLQEPLQPSATTAATAADPTEPATPKAIVLRQPLPLPPTLSRLAMRGNRQRPVLLALWSQDCARCTDEITKLAAQSSLLRDAGIEILFLGIYKPGEQAKAALRFRELLAPHKGASQVMRQRPASAAAQKAFAALLTAIVGREPAPPTSLLIDAQGRAQVLYVAEVSPANLLSHLNTFAREDAPGPLRTDRGGRWAFAVERALNPLIQAFAREGLTRDAAFFADLEKKRQAKANIPQHAPK